MSSTQKSTSKEHEARHRKVLEGLLKKPENKECADCTAKGVNLWASVNLGVFDCIKCAGIHRNLGVHISKVRSVTLDKWTDEQVETMQRIGNARAKEIYEANGAPPKPREDEDASVIERYIRNKYEKKMWMSRGGDEAPQRTTKHVRSESEEERPRRERTDRSFDEEVPTRSTPNRRPQQTQQPQKQQQQPPQQQRNAPSLIDFDELVPPVSGNNNNNNNNTDFFSQFAPQQTQQPQRQPQQTQQQPQRQPQQQQQQQPKATDFFEKKPAASESILSMFDQPSQPTRPVNNLNNGNYPPMNNQYPPMNNQYPPMHRPPVTGNPYPPMMGGNNQYPPMGRGPMMNQPPMHPPMMNNNGPLSPFGNQPPMMGGHQPPMMRGAPQPMNRGPPPMGNYNQPPMNSGYNPNIRNNGF